MIENKNNTFIGARVILDGNSFEECVFQNCVLEFGGTAPVNLVNNRIVDCQWSFVGPAAATVSFMSGVYNGLGSEGQKLVEAIFDNIRRGYTNAPPVPTPAQSSAQPI